MNPVAVSGVPSNPSGIGLSPPRLSFDFVLRAVAGYAVGLGLSEDRRSLVNVDGFIGAGLAGVFGLAGVAAQAAFFVGYPMFQVHQSRKKKRSAKA